LALALSDGQCAQGRYEVQSPIAVGGMGAVYRVRDRTTGELQALKRLSSSGAGRGNRPARGYAIEAFEREYHLLATLDHPRIIRVFDYGVDSAGPFYTMELLEGQDLRSAAPLPSRTACAYLRDVATSLALLHNRHVLHRDLSPANIRVTQDGRCKLLDFGALASFGPSPHVVGTPPFIAPEVLDGAPLDQRTDLYALGALAYWLLTGQHAYPARNLVELPERWASTLLPPSVHVPGVPLELDALVLSLLHHEPRGRIASAAEVIARLEVIGQLDPEDCAQSTLLAQSFLTSPRLTGREQEMRLLSGALARTLEGYGSLVHIASERGLGRSRLLTEAMIQARLAGAWVLHADARACRQPLGVAHALVRQLISRVERTAVPVDPTPAAPLALDDALNVGARREREPTEWRDLVVRHSQQRPLVLVVDNLEDADEGSYAWLDSLSTAEWPHAVLVLVAEASSCTESVEPLSARSAELRQHAQTLTLEAWSRDELLELLGSMFADAPNLVRFADWLHERAAGSPLHTLTVCRGLLQSGAVRYERGLWTLPAETPCSEPPAGLAGTLSLRMRRLSPAARTLAECLSLSRQHPTRTMSERLCQALPDGSTTATHLLAELRYAAVLQPHTGDDYRFSSAALRGVLVQELKASRLHAHHRRLAEAYLQDPDDAQHIEAGFHFIEAGEELRGAELIASIARDSDAFAALNANALRAGRPVEMALDVYRRHGRSSYEQLPLLAALMSAGYCESRYYGEKYADEALRLLMRLSGLSTAQRLRRWLGAKLSLGMGVLLAYLRYLLAPRCERGDSFTGIVKRLLGSVTALTAVATLSLDAVRAEQLASLLEPFACLPQRFTPVGVYQFCRALSLVPRENQSAAYAAIERLISRFSDQANYRALSSMARRLYLAGLHFARGALGVFRAHGQATLESAAALDATGLRLHGMFANQLRCLYYDARGQTADVARYRAQVERQLTDIGSLWQVETWEAAASVLTNAVAMGDVVSTTRSVHQLEALSRSVPSLRRYSVLASHALVSVHRDRRYLHELQALDCDAQPRAYVGWAATMSVVVRSYNQVGDFAGARAFAARALSHVGEADREWAALFVPLDIQTAIADAGLGEVDSALSRLDHLIERFADCGHALVQGLLHEARAHICWEAGRLQDYESSRAQAERWLRPTQVPALLAKCEQLASLTRSAPEESVVVRRTRTEPASEREELATVELGSRPWARSSATSR